MSGHDVFWQVGSYLSEWPVLKTTAQDWWLQATPSARAALLRKLVWAGPLLQDWAWEFERGEFLGILLAAADLERDQVEPEHT